MVGYLVGIAKNFSFSKKKITLTYNLFHLLNNNKAAKNTFANRTKNKWELVMFLLFLSKKKSQYIFYASLFYTA